MTFDDLSNFVSFVNDTKRYEKAILELKSKEESIQAALKQQGLVGDIVKLKEAAEVSKEKAEALIEEAKQKAEKIVANATVVFDKRHAELKEREIIAEQAITDYKAVKALWTTRENELRLLEKQVLTLQTNTEKEKAIVASKQLEVDQRLEKLRQAMG